MAAAADPTSAAIQSAPTAFGKRSGTSDAAVQIASVSDSRRRGARPWASRPATRAAIAYTAPMAVARARLASAEKRYFSAVTKNSPAQNVPLADGAKKRDD